MTSFAQRTPKVLRVITRLSVKGRGSGPKAPRQGHGRIDGDTYSTGQTVKQSGIYEVIHNASHRSAHEVVMLSGDVFPDCDTCGERVRFHLIRTAPYIFQDEDFEENK